MRYEVVMAIISAAKKDFTAITEELLNFVKERTLDKKVRAPALRDPSVTRSHRVPIRDLA